MLSSVWRFLFLVQLYFPLYLLDDSTSPGGPFVPPQPVGTGGSGPFVPPQPVGTGGSGPFVPPQPVGTGGSGPFVPPQPVGSGPSVPGPDGGYTPPPTYKGWAHWGQCTVTCGGGVMYRVRDCGTAGCGGHDKELKPCLARKACPAWGPWSDWSYCSYMNEQSRSRQCQGGYGYSGCAGSSTDSRPCSSYVAPQPAPVYVIPAPVAPPPPISYYSAIYNQYYHNRGKG